MSSKSNSNVRPHRAVETAASLRSADQAMTPVLRLLRAKAPPGIDVEASRLGLLMLWLADDIIRAVNRHLEPFDISDKKLDVLLIFAAQLGMDDDEIARHPDAMLQTPTGVSEYFGVTRSTATGLLDWLEKRELVARKSHPSDRRSTRIEISAAGERLVDDAMPIFWQAIAGLATGLTERDKKDLDRVLTKIWDQLKSAPAG